MQVSFARNEVELTGLSRREIAGLACSPGCRFQRPPKTGQIDGYTLYV